MSTMCYREEPSKKNNDVLKDLDVKIEDFNTNKLFIELEKKSGDQDQKNIYLDDTGQFILITEEELLSFESDKSFKKVYISKLTAEEIKQLNSQINKNSVDKIDKLIEESDYISIKDEKEVCNKDEDACDNVVD